METEIFEKVKKVFVDEFEIEENMITQQSLIFDELGLDSLDSVDLIVALEKEFGFKVDRAQDGPIIAQIKSIQDIINYVSSKK
ncbi:MAG TPA: acyl carrier protein [Bacillota bacterium]|jgi:acyl carrier protein|nr:acyl carrier protein [Bacillota bacterium]HOL08575.1 acyl carrier protein [Bacillota bacterium]HPO97811.1 acyl carrier protein [Bacillota bacterium]